MLSAAPLLLLSVAAANATGGGHGELVAPVAVGEPAPPPAVLAKLGELMRSSLTSAGLPEPPAHVDPAAPMVAAARDAYYDLDFARAQAQAEEALAHYERNPQDIHDAVGWVAARLFAALPLLERGDADGARSHFLQLLTIRPDLRLSDAEFSPTAIVAFEGARDVWRSRRAFGQLTVSSSPAFAEVLLDGRPVGQTPLTLDRVLHGRHFVTIRRDGLLPQTSWVQVGASSASVSATLTEDPRVTTRAAVRAAIREGHDPRRAAQALTDRRTGGGLLLLAVADVQEHYLLSAAWLPTEGHAARAYAAVGKDLLDAASVSEQTVRALLDATSSEPRAVGQLAPTHRVAYADYFMGLGPPKAPAAVEEPPWWHSPWVWVAAGVLAAGTGTGVYLLTRPEAPPPTVTVSLELPQ